MFRAITTNAILVTAITAAISTKASALDYSTHCINPREGASSGFAGIEINGTTAKIEQHVPVDDFGVYDRQLYPKVVFNQELRQANLITADESIAGFTTELSADKCQLTGTDQHKSLKCVSTGKAVANVTLQITGIAGFRNIEGFTVDYVELNVGDAGTVEPMNEVVLSLGNIKGHGMLRAYASTQGVYSPELCHQ